MITIIATKPANQGTNGDTTSDEIGYSPVIINSISNELAGVENLYFITFPKIVLIGPMRPDECGYTELDVNYFSNEALVPDETGYNQVLINTLNNKQITGGESFVQVIINFFNAEPVVADDINHIQLIINSFANEPLTLVDNDGYFAPIIINSFSNELLTPVDNEAFGTGIIINSFSNDGNYDADYIDGVYVVPPFEPRTNRGYWIGSTTTGGNVFGIKFDTEVAYTKSAVIKRSLTGFYGTASSSTIGYIAGGETATHVGTNSIDKFHFSSETETTNVQYLSDDKYGLIGVDSTTTGYFGGGVNHAFSDCGGHWLNYGACQMNYTGQTNPFEFDTIDSFDFATETSTRSSEKLVTRRRDMAGFSSEVKGYWYGGYNCATLSKEIDCIEFATNTVKNPGSSLAIPKLIGGGANSNSDGYHIGSNASNTYNVEGLDFSTETSVNYGNALSIGSPRPCNNSKTAAYSCTSTSVLKFNFANTAQYQQSASISFGAYGEHAGGARAGFDGTVFDYTGMSYNHVYAAYSGRGYFSGVNTHNWCSAIIMATATQVATSAALYFDRNAGTSLTTQTTGYFVGGLIYYQDAIHDAAISYFSLIDALSFATETSYLKNASLDEALSGLAGTGNQDKGYITGGARRWGAGGNGNIRRYDYANDSCSVIASFATIVSNQRTAFSLPKAYFFDNRKISYMKYDTDTLGTSNSVPKLNATNVIPFNTCAYIIGYPVLYGTAAKTQSFNFEDETLITTSYTASMPHSNMGYVASNNKGYLTGSDDYVYEVNKSNGSVSNIGAFLGTGSVSNKGVYDSVFDYSGIVYADLDHLSNRGYFSGGTGGTTEIDGINFASLAAINPGSALSIARAGHASFSSSEYAFWSGGSSGTTCDNMKYADESMSSFGSYISETLTFVGGTNNGDYGLYIGGYHGTSAYPRTTISGCVFSNSSAFTLGTGLAVRYTYSNGVEVGRYGVMATASYVKAYAIGGGAWPSGTELKSIETVDFATWAVTEIAAQITYAKRDGGVAFRTGVDGFTADGWNGSTVYSNVEKISFTSDTNSSIGVSIAALHGQGVSSTQSIAYLAGGQTTSPYVNTIYSFNLYSYTTGAESATLTSNRYNLSGADTTVYYDFGDVTINELADVIIADEDSAYLQKIINNIPQDSIQVSDSCGYLPLKVNSFAAEGVIGETCSYTHLVVNYFSNEPLTSDLGWYRKLTVNYFSNEPLTSESLSYKQYIIFSPPYKSMSGDEIYYVNKKFNTFSNEALTSDFGWYKTTPAAIDMVNKGYWFGGTTGSNSTEIDGISFVDDSATNSASAITARKQLTATSSGTKSYTQGGFIAATSGLTETYTFSSEAIASLSLGFISRSKMSSCSSSSKGYTIGGDTTGSNVASSVIESILFSGDTAVSVSATLTTARYDAVGTESSLTGYAISGNASITSIEGITFATDAKAAISSVLTAGRLSAGSSRSTDNGYIAGGGASLTSMELIDFSSNSTLTSNTVLATGRYGLAGTSSKLKGYYGGGWNGTAYYNEIDGVTFADQTAINPSITLNTSRTYLASGTTTQQSASTAQVITSPKGYFAGGINTAITKTIFSLSFDSETISIAGTNLNEVKETACGFNSATRGYIAGGGNGNTSFTSIDYINFNTQITAKLTTVLGTASRLCSSVQSDTAGYVCGGYNGTTALNTVQKYTFASDTIANTTAMTATRNHGLGVYSKNAGYVALGNQGTQADYVEKINFANDVTSTLLSRIKQIRFYMSGSGVESNAEGYVFGGSYSGTQATAYNIIDRIDFNTENVNTISATTVSSRYYYTGASATDRGYMAGGYDSTNGNYSEIEGIKFADQTSTNPSVGLSVATRTMASTQTTVQSNIAVSTVGSNTSYLSKCYYGGGSSIASGNSTVQIYDLDQNISSTANFTLRNPRMQSRLGMNSSVSGFVHNGATSTGNNWTTDIEGIYFATNSSFLVATKAIAGKRLQESLSDSNVGYCCGGYDGGYPTAIEKFDFGTFAASTHSYSLTKGRHAAGYSSMITAGYLFGGSSNLGYFHDIEKLTFVNGTISAIAAKISEPRDHFATCTSNNVAYNGGGYSQQNSTGVTNIDSFHYVNESSQNPVMAMSQKRFYHTSCNSYNRGAWCGGYDGTTAYSTVDGVVFSTETYMGYSFGTFASGYMGVSINTTTSSAVTEQAPTQPTLPEYQKGYVSSGRIGSTGSYLIDCCYILRYDVNIWYTHNQSIHAGDYMPLTGVNNSYVGYSAGGYYYNGYNQKTISKVRFADDTINSGLSMAVGRRQMNSMSSQTDGYWVGGYRESTYASDYSHVGCKLSFANETTSEMAASVTYDRTDTSGAESFTKGYIYTDYSRDHYAITTVDFATDTFGTLGSKTASYYYSRTCVRSNNAMFVAGGYGAATLVEGLDFFTETVTNVYTDLVTGRSFAAGLSGAATGRGYICGGFNGASTYYSNVTSINNITYAVVDVNGMPNYLAMCTGITTVQQTASVATTAFTPKGYICGGLNSSSVRLNIVDIFYYDNLYCAVSSMGLNRTTQEGSGCNSATFGYMYGYGGSTNIEKVSFATDVFGIHGTALMGFSDPRQGGGFSAPTKGYFSGNNSNTLTIQIITFATDTMAASANSLIQKRWLFASVNSTTDGYMLGGGSTLATNDFCNKINFATDTDISLSARMPYVVYETNAGCYSQNLGYVMGGFVSGTASNIIQGISFPTDTTFGIYGITLSSNSRDNTGLSYYDYSVSCGGYSGSAYLTNIDGVYNQTMTSFNAGNDLTLARLASIGITTWQVTDPTYTSTLSAPTTGKGYCVGGYTGSVVKDTVFCLTYATEVGTTIVYTLGVPGYKGCGFNSLVKGYNHTGYRTAVDKSISAIRFDNNVTMTTAMNLGTAKSETCASSAATTAYIFGGSTTGSVNVIEGAVYGSETTYVVSATLSLARNKASSFINGTTKAYVTGGHDYTWIEGFNVSNESIALISATLLTPATTIARYEMVGTFSSLKGYLSGGTTAATSTVFNAIYALTFASETLATLAATVGSGNTRSMTGLSSGLDSVHCGGYTTGYINSVYCLRYATETIKGTAYGLEVSKGYCSGINNGVFN